MAKSRAKTQAGINKAAAKAPAEAPKKKVNRHQLRDSKGKKVLSREYKVGKATGKAARAAGEIKPGKTGLTAKGAAELRKSKANSTAPRGTRSFLRGVRDGATGAKGSGGP